MTFGKTDILLPADGIDLTKWSVVACDQYTSQPEYWDGIAAEIGDAPSALNIVYPEAYLSGGDARIEKINRTMADYLDRGLFKALPDSLIYTERMQSNGKIRRGIVGAADLEDYDFKKGAKSKIRATEGTVLERIPPRVKIREGAPLELPHIILLIDDPARTVIEPCEKADLLYDFELMAKGGHVSGSRLSGEAADRALSALDTLGKSCPGGILLAVGDGNHSLAAAKTCWDNIKKTLTPKERETHPARFCLVEIENIHDPALEFEPIHRVLFGVEPEEVLAELLAYYPEASYEDNGGCRIDYVFGKTTGSLYIKNSGSALAVGALQAFIDAKGYKTDYIHGAEVTKSLAEREGCMGFLLPAMEKSALFPAVAADGALPRKTFSMGEAQDKRFYLEAKRIK